MTQTISIIGSGMIGGQVARLAVSAGFNVVISNSRGPETLVDLVAELGPLAKAATAGDAIKASSLIVASIPFKNYKDLSPDALAGKIVIDTLNYYPERDSIMPEVKTESVAESELLQRHLSKSIVVKAINNMDWIRLLSCARAKNAPDRSALPIAGDDAKAVAVVSNFIDTIGYDPVHYGTLVESWRSEPTTPVYVFPYIAKNETALSPDAIDEFFVRAPGAVVSSEEVKSLLSKAVRHDNMVGSMSAIRENFTPA